MKTRVILFLFIILSEASFCGILSSNILERNGIKSGLNQKSNTKRDTLYKSKVIQRISTFTIDDIRGGKADTALFVQLAINGKLYNFKYDPNSKASDDSASVIRYKNRRYIVDVDIITPKLFGAKGDGISDDTSPIQKAIDYATYIKGGGKIYIEEGTFKVTNTLHLGYGINFKNSPYVTIQLQGSGGGRAAQGTKIIPTFHDKPVISVTAGRQIKISGIQIIGDPFAANSGLLFPNKILGADNKMNWSSPKWPKSATSETAPFAAIAIDPYAGPRPNISYPDVIFPKFLGTPVQYNKPATSDIEISSVVITGFQVAIVLTPSGSNSQNDFIKLEKIWIDYCTYGISISHTDCREVSLTNSYISSCHTAITTGAHGMKLGNWGGAIINVAFDRCIQWFDFSDPAYPRTGPIKFINCYGECVWRLGNFGSSNTGSNRDTNLAFDHCSVKFVHNGLLGIPSTILSTTTHSYVTFHGGFFAFFEGAFSIQGDMGKFSFEDGVVIENGSLRNQEYERHAESTTGGGIIFSHPLLTNGFKFKPASFSLKHSAYTNTKLVFREITKPTTSSASNVPCIYSQSAVGESILLNEGNQLTKPVSLPLFYLAREKSDFLAISLSNRDLTIKFPKEWDNEIYFLQKGGMPGDIIVDNSSGSVFYIYNKTGNIVKAKLQNNYRVANNTYSYLKAINTSLISEERFLIINTRLYTPEVYTSGTFTQGSNMITNVSDESGNSKSLSTQFPIGNAILTDPETDNIYDYSGNNNVILSVDNLEQKITTVGKSLKSQRKRIEIVISAGCKNVE